MKKAFWSKILRIFITFSLVVSSINFLSFNVFALNTLANPGFENGSSNWVTWTNNSSTFTVDSLNPHTGVYCGKIQSQNTSGSGVWSQEITAGFSVGDQVNVSGYIKTDNVVSLNSGGAKLSITCYDNLSNVLKYDNSISVTGTTSYTNIKVSTTIPYNTSFYTVTLCLSDASGTVYFDDISSDLSSNKALNPGFENGSSNWVSWSDNSSTFEINSVNPHTGGYCAKITSPSNNGIGIWAQDINSGFTAGNHINLTGYIKTDNVVSATGTGARLTITCYSALGTALSYDTSKYITGTTAYSLVNLSVMIPSGTSFYRITPAIADATGTAYFDDISIIITNNPILNNGFENGTTQTQWVHWSSGSPVFEINSQYPRTGTYCAKIQSSNANDNSIWAQNISSGFSAGDHLYVTGYIKTDNIIPATGGGAKLAVTCYDSSGACVYNTTNKLITGTTSYSLAEILIIIPNGTVFYTVSVGISNATGTAYFDDISSEIQTRTVGAQTNAEIKQDGGMPTLYVDGEKQAPMFFCGNTEHNDATSLNKIYQEFNKAGVAGINLGSIVLNLPWSWENYADVDNMINTIIANNPNVKLLIRVRVAPPIWWYSRYPSEFIQYSDGTYNTSFPSYGSTKWISDAKDNLRTFIRYIRSSNYSDKVIGYYLGSGSGDEWFYTDLDTDKYGDYNPLNVTRFRSWLTTKYSTDAALKTAWNDSAVTLTTANIPTATERKTINETFFINTSTATTGTKVSDYAQYLNEVVADTISDFAAVVKQEAGGSKSLCGTFYGYLNELANNGNSAITNSGHLATQKLLKDSNIDIIGAPYSYVQRAVGQVSGWHGPIDSITAAGKLYMMEDDTRTYLCTDTLSKANNLSETLSIVERNFGQVISHGTATWYFDLCGDGTWNDTNIWTQIGSLKNVYQTYLNTTRSFTPDVAVIFSETTPCFLRPDRSSFDIPTMSDWRFELQKTGARIGFYYIDQLEAIPDTTKLYIFDNTFKLSTDETNRINAKVKKNGNTVVWTYAPGYVTDSGTSITNVSNMVGMTIVKNTSSMALRTKITNTTNPISKNLVNSTYGITTAMTPSFYVNDASTTSLGVYTGSTSKSALAVKEMTNWTSIFTGSPDITVNILRSIMKYAGVQLYTDDNMAGKAGVYATDSLVVIHPTTALTSGTYNVKLPYLASIVTNTLTGATVATNTDSFFDTFSPSVTKMYSISNATKGINLLQNAGFESGASNWTYSGTDNTRWTISDRFVDGSHSSKIIKSGSADDIVYQNINTSNNASYLISGYVKTKISNSLGNGAVAFVGYNAQNVVVDYIFRIYSGVASWKYFSYNYTPSPTVTYFQLQLISNGTWNVGDEAYWDNFSVVKNSCANASFEQGGAGWTYSGSNPTRWTFDSDISQDGSKSSKISRSGSGANDEIYQSISATVGDTYYISAYLKTKITNTLGYIDFIITGYDNNGVAVGTSTTITYTGYEGWRKATVLYTVPSGAVSFRVRCVSRGTWNTGNTMWIDNINVCKMP